MTSLRDTSGDALAAACAEQAAREAGEFDPPVTISGRDAKRLREIVTDGHAFLLDIEERTKLYRERERIRMQRIAFGAALALLPKPPVEE